jgi:hypothetical protein
VTQDDRGAAIGKEELYGGEGRGPGDVAVEAGIVGGRDWEDALDSLPWEEGEVPVIPCGADVRLQDAAPAARGFVREQ